jgi:hypothetical protein
MVADLLHSNLGPSVTEYNYIDFCAGAGGPTPLICRLLNRRIKSDFLIRNPDAVINGDHEAAAQFVMTDLHPHIPDWQRAAARSKQLTFIPRPIDASRAPADILAGTGLDSSKPVFRLFNLAFHHFDDPLAADILRDTLRTSGGIAIFELQDRSIGSFITMVAMAPMLFLMMPFFFWRDPVHLFFTYIIPIIPFVIVFDGLVSSVRTRTPAEVLQLAKRSGGDLDGWVWESGRKRHTWPTGYITYVIGRKT